LGKDALVLSVKIRHHALIIELLDEWWAEAGMIGFVPRCRAYRTSSGSFENQQIQEVSIEEVGPVCRSSGVGIFNDSSEGMSARERVVSILRGFRLNAVIPRVEIVESLRSSAHRYKLVHGAHRFYCSLAAGFTHVPTVRGFDWESLSPSDKGRD
jgi:hypothetical protein